MDKYNGCQDNQTEEQKIKNYKLNEVCSIPDTVNWVEKTSWKEYPLRNQNTSLTCVCQTMSTEMGIIAQQKYGEWIDFSASFTYQQRGGTYGGCSSTDIYSLFPKLGDVTELIMPSQNLNESGVLSVERKKYYSDLAKPFSISRVELPVDFETVCSTLQATGKGVMLWFHIGLNEWTEKPEVKTMITNSNHSVTAIDFGLISGKKYIRIMDSSGACYRFISEEYFNAKCYLASYLKSFEFITGDTKPHFNGSVKSLQECLIYEGLLGVGLNTGFFGTLTKNALIKFQIKYKISPALGYFGVITKAKLYLLYL
jgi:hypothetical protein